MASSVYSIGQIKPLNLGDTYPIVEDTHIKGGFRVATDLDELKAIPDARRKNGMIGIVHVSAQKYQMYRLNQLNAWEELDFSPKIGQNGNWIIDGVDSGVKAGGAGATLTPQQLEALTELVNARSAIRGMQTSEKVLLYFNGNGSFSRIRPTQISYSNAAFSDVTNIGNALDHIFEKIKPVTPVEGPIKKTYFGFSTNSNLVDPTRLDVKTGNNHRDSKTYKGTYTFSSDLKNAYMYFFIPKVQISTDPTITIGVDQTSAYQVSDVTFNTEEYKAYRSKRAVTLAMEYSVTLG